ncbi:uncharacterized protein N7483_008647 [Penicillium malachiteum]|uniref:uncharacterized protein n=1 Tax=Penicillium malachiteum TaxID=1324776 RepID=UPI002547368E|nr:uncharacterized protein N7483_008647 [Penicillium malachiteum]KAJ5720713.1 hypothetical protein N7483_008647 [Penicillium malachiteum]
MSTDEKEQDSPVHDEHLETQVPVQQNNNNGNTTWREVWEHRRVLLWCLFIFLLPINFGYEVTTVGNLLAVNSFLKEFGVEIDGAWEVSARDQQILNAASTIGLFCSAFTTGVISDLMGRKKTIIVGCLICVAGILTQFFSHTILQIFGGKLLSTFGFGLGHSLGPVFVAELAPPNVRGICLTLVNTMIVLGEWLNSLAILGCQNRSDSLAWRIPIITQLVPPSLLLLGLPFLAESPSWLIMKDRPEEARKSFLYFNGPKFDVDEAMAITTAAVAQERELARSGSAWLDCFRGDDLRRTGIVCMVYIAQQLVGVNFVSGYLTYYFKLAGVKDSIATAQGAYAVQLFGNICSWPLVDRLGRRPMIVGGMFAITIGLFIIGCISINGSAAALKATVALMTLWGFLYQATIGAVAYAVGGETPSPLLRQKTYSINIMSATAFSCAVLQILPYLINTDEANMGGKVCFVFFGLSVPMCVYLYFYMPELKGRTVAEIQEMFQAKVPARKFKGYVCQNQLQIEKDKAIMEDE